MKKFLSVILVILTLLSLTACGDVEQYLLITAPGTYELQVFNKDNPQQEGEFGVTSYVRAQVVATGENIQYVSGAEMYGCERVGATITVENPWIFPAKYENAKIKLALSFSYRTYYSKFNYRIHTTDKVEVEIELDENGYAQTTVYADIDEDVKNNPYMKGLAFYCVSDTYNTDGVLIYPITEWVEASGTVTFYEKVDPTKKPVVATPTPAESVEPAE